MQCDARLRTQIQARLRQFPVRVAEDQSLRPSAVAVLVTDEGMGADLPGLDNPSSWSSDAALMLTRRSEQLRHHPGQWAFPGGRVDAGETLAETALRELHEEVGIDLPLSAVLGTLDDFVTRSGFAMTPVVVWGGARLQATPNPAEVASVHRIPLREFLREDAPLLDATDTSEHPILRMPVGDDYIAAPTAALIYQFREVCVLGRQTRVAHFEQPEFAWK
ncbi:MAG: CoA pyrophosphatase [Pseudomonadota bacterium]